MACDRPRVCQHLPVPCSSRESVTLASGVPLGTQENEVPSQALKQQAGRIVWLPLTTPEILC